MSLNYDKLEICSNCKKSLEAALFFYEQIEMPIIMDMVMHIRKNGYIVLKLI